MKFLDNNIQALGLGCWPIGGEMYGADGTSLGLCLNPLCKRLNNSLVLKT